MLSPQTRKISQIDRNPAVSPDLSGALVEMSLPSGPSGGYVSFAISYEQLTARLGGPGPAPANQLRQDELEAIQQAHAPSAVNLFLTAADLATALKGRDPYAVGNSATVPLAVLDPTNTWVKGDLTAYGSAALQQAGAPPAVARQHASILVGTADVQTRDEFDYGGYRFVYARRNDGTSGWTRLQKA